MKFAWSMVQVQQGLGHMFNYQSVVEEYRKTTEALKYATRACRQRETAKG